MSAPVVDERAVKAAIDAARVDRCNSLPLIVRRAIVTYLQECGK